MQEHELLELILPDLDVTSAGPDPRRLPVRGKLYFLFPPNFLILTVLVWFPHYFVITW
jgi:hypothetical protein